MIFFCFAQLNEIQKWSVYAATAVDHIYPSLETANQSFRIWNFNMCTVNDTVCKIYITRKRQHSLNALSVGWQFLINLSNLFKLANTAMWFSFGLAWIFSFTNASYIGCDLVVFDKIATLRHSFQCAGMWELVKIETEKKTNTNTHAFNSYWETSKHTHLNTFFNRMWCEHQIKESNAYTNTVKWAFCQHIYSFQWIDGKFLHKFN